MKVLKKRLWGRWALAGVFLLGLCWTARAAESAAERDTRMAWWNDARFGLFIHWGVYSVPAGEWEGKKDYGEWFLEQTKMPVSQYEKFADQFNPVKFDAKEWVRMAKDAGVKYIVITSKHHDGFGMYRSALTDWCISRTPFPRDPLKELSDACKEQGITFCCYYSIMDWHHPDWGTRRAWNDTAAGTPDMDRYVTFMKGQLKELITGYGPLGVLWFDGEWEKPWTHERGVDLYTYLRGLQPSLIINNRIGKGRSGMQGMDDGQGVGDYGTPEQEIPPTGFGPRVAWESCMTMNDHWGYNKNDNHWKSAQTLIRNLIDCASKGGNYLLNVGPTSEGLIPVPSVERLAEIGRWMKVNGESIYGTTASPFEKLAWGRCTKKPGMLYLHVFDWPKNGRLFLPGLVNQPLKAVLLADGQSLSVSSGAEGVTIALPAAAPDPIASVVALSIKGEPKIVKPDPYADETKAQRDARMAWWRDARFGMFIHWGVYAVPAGVWQGKDVPGIGEWIMNHGKIPCADYQAFAKSFNPTAYDPDEWVRAAKDAGMKYIVITAKHHDGFAMFDTRASDWSIVKASPYGKDVLKPLADACRKYGIKLGFYYSQAQDWNNGGSACNGKWDPAQTHDMDDYIDKVAVPQVRELMTDYGEFPAVLWWDTPCDMNPERAAKLSALLKLKPGIIHNNRLGGGFSGDTETPEQFVPATGFKDRDWETCMTMNDTWGYKSKDNEWKSTAVLLRHLVDIASKGGNYLLNVGPTAEGRIPQPSLERLEEIGRWMKVNGESIYGTTASPFGRFPWGRCTQKVSADGTEVYLHVFDWPADGELPVYGLKNAQVSARLLATGAALNIASDERGVVVKVPAAAPDAVCSVIALHVKGALSIEPFAQMQASDGSLKLTADSATLHGELRLEDKHKSQNIGFWTRSDDWVEWTVRLSKPGTFAVSAELAAPGAAEWRIEAGGRTLSVKSPATGGYEAFQTLPLGTLVLDKAEKLTFAVRPVKSGWHPINLVSLTLTPEAK